MSIGVILGSGKYPSIISLHKNSFLSYWVEEGQIKIEIGRKRCVYIKEWFK